MKYSLRWIILLLAGLLSFQAKAQLAITEVMAEGATNNYPYKGPDWFELTNFGTNDIPLEGYSFNDSRQTYGAVFYPFSGLVIHAGESVIFFRVRPYNITTNAETYRQWWGESNLPPNLQIRTYLDPGFDGQAGDETWVYDSEMNVVDSVKFGASKPGHSFTYDPDTGIFGVVSTLGLNGSFQAALDWDIGSPGTTTGPSPLRIVEHPASQTVDGGGQTTFSIKAAGMPRPRYQWLFGGAPIPGATSPTLTISWFF